MNEWHLVQNNEEHQRTFSSQEISQILKHYPEDTLWVWREGREQWENPRNLPEFGPVPLKALITGGFEEAAAFIRRNTEKGHTSTDWSSWFREEPKYQKLALASMTVGAIAALLTYDTATFAETNGNLIYTLAFFFLTTSIVTYFLLGRRVFGHLPHVDIFIHVSTALLGPVRGVRRRITYTSLFILPFLFGALAQASLNKPPNQIILSILMPSLGYFYLFGYYQIWRLTGKSRYGLLPKLGPWEKHFKETIAKRFKQSGLKNLHLEVCDVMDAPLYQFASFESGTTKQQLQITLGRARIILVTQRQGEYLYIRIDRFLDFSNRRIWLLILIFLELINKVSERWTGYNITTLSRRIWLILFDWRYKSTTGAIGTGDRNYESESMSESQSLSVFMPAWELDHLRILDQTMENLLKSIIHELSPEEDLAEAEQKSRFFNEWIVDPHRG